MASSLNGTGVTFNDGTTLQSGNIPAANLGSGTANSNTFLRGDRTFATPPSQAPTTAQVLSATAGAAVGAVGTYGLMGARSTSQAREPGQTRAGSQLSFRNVDNNGSTAATAGTWRVMGMVPNNFSGSVWLRIS